MNVDSILREINEVLYKKNEDCGEDNLLQHGQLGIIIRCSDKLARLKNISGGVGKVGEPTEKEWIDIAGYAIQAIRLIREGKI